MDGLEDADVHHVGGAGEAVTGVRRGEYVHVMWNGQWRNAQVTAVHEQGVLDLCAFVHGEEVHLPAVAQGEHGWQPLRRITAGELHGDRFSVNHVTLFGVEEWQVVDIKDNTRVVFDTEAEAVALCDRLNAERRK